MDSPRSADWTLPASRKTRRESISGTHGWTDSVGGSRTASDVPSEGGPRASSLRSVSDVAHSLCAVVLQPRPSPGQVLSDPAMEDMLYEIESVRRFVGVRLSGPLPDETTILNFRHRTHDLGESVRGDQRSESWPASSGRDDSGCEHNRGPSSTKNRGVRDPEMHQTKKGNEWYFGMKVHIGVDSQTGHTAYVRHRPMYMT